MIERFFCRLFVFFAGDADRQNDSCYLIFRYAQDIADPVVSFINSQPAVNPDRCVTKCRYRKKNILDRCGAIFDLE